MALKSRSGRPPAVTAASAEAMALEALAFLAADEGRLDIAGAGDQSMMFGDPAR